MKGRAALRRAVERLSEEDLERAIEAALRRDYGLAERLIAAAAPGRARKLPGGLPGRPAARGSGGPHLQQGAASCILATSAPAI